MDTLQTTVLVFCLGVFAFLRTLETVDWFVGAKTE